MKRFFESGFARGRGVLAAVGVMAAVVSAWAQSGGLPGNYIITDRWRQAYSMYSGITNPAFVNEENYMAIRGLWANTLEMFDMFEFGFNMPLGLYDAAGISWMMHRTPTFNATDTAGRETSQKISDQGNFIALTYARNVWKGLTVGGNLNIITQNVAEFSGSADDKVENGMRFGFGLDIGLTYKVLRHQLLGNHILGLSTNNIVNVITGTDEKYAAALRFSLLSDFWERRICYGADFVLKDILAGETDWLGDNPIKDMPWDFNQKLGFNILRIFKLYALVGLGNDGIDHYGFAFGANLPGFVNGRDIEGMMQYVSIANAANGTSAASANHLTFYLRGELGKHREEIYARNMARRGTLGPNNLYNQALDLYYKGEYFRAYWIFSQIAVEYPDFFRNDMVSYYQGACIEGMDMRQSAVMAFKRTKEEHSRSVAVPMADLGLMRVFYRSGDFSAVASQFEELNALGVPDSIKYHAYYIMGQTEIQRGDYQKARELFTMIPENHPDYVFAYHAAAVANAMADNMQGAIADLEFVIQIKPKNKAQEEAINRSYVFLGFLYYEDLATEGALARAVTALRKVPKNSYYYQDALLGLGWTALKARQWPDCLSAGAELVKTATDPVLQSEGSLLQAYAQAMQKNYAPAVSLLEEASKRLESYSGPSEADLAANRNEYENVRSEYETMGVRLDELGQARQSSVVQTSIDSLQGPQSKSKASIDQHVKFEDEFKRKSFFSRNMETVKDDIGFAMAKFSRYARSSGAKDAGKKSGGGVDDELEKLKKELEGMK
jgi:tetratricopeptide (TPR) repeat protein